MLGINLMTYTLKNFDNDLIEDVKFLRKTKSKIIFYELSASTGSRELKVIEHVDLFLKRQLFKDRSMYLKEKQP